MISKSVFGFVLFEKKRFFLVCIFIFRKLLLTLLKMELSDDIMLAYFHFIKISCLICHIALLNRFVCNNYLINCEEE